MCSEYVYMNMAYIYCFKISMAEHTPPTPSDVTNAIHTDGFEENAPAFWDLCNYLMKTTGNPNSAQTHVWQQIPSAVHAARILAKKLKIVLMKTQVEELDARKLTIYNTYLIMVSILRGPNTITEWMAHEEVDVLKALSHIYGTLTMIKSRENKLVGLTFGQLP